MFVSIDGTMENFNLSVFNACKSYAVQTQEPNELQSFQIRIGLGIDFISSFINIYKVPMPFSVRYAKS